MANVYVVQRQHEGKNHVVAVFSHEDTARFHCNDMNDYLRSQPDRKDSRYFYYTMPLWETTVAEMQKDNSEIATKSAQ